MRRSSVSGQRQRSDIRIEPDRVDSRQSGVDGHAYTDAQLDSVLDASFPASDPPPWTTSVARVSTEPSERTGQAAGRGHNAEKARTI